MSKRRDRVGAVTVRVPASTANVGPGYDSFALGLALYDVFTASAADEWRVVDSGAFGEKPSGASELTVERLVVKSMKRAFAEVSSAPRACAITCVRQIPSGRGLGSSACEIVGGLVLADAMTGNTLGVYRLLQLAFELECHPDNVAAALLGGFTVSWVDDGYVGATSVPVRCGLAVVAAVSESPLPTSTSRSLLPEMVPHADAAFNVGRAGALVAGLASGSDDLIRSGLSDRLHERYRASAIAGYELVASAISAAGAVGAVLSGAGPTVVGLVTGASDEEALTRARSVAERAGPHVRRAGGYRTPVALAVDRMGATLVEPPEERVAHEHGS